ncbi:MAG: bifunctional 4-hydroxy-2-oxoglutarate aldolase/2-dehydro-3-deoxy-phosphogluconate aldolase [Spirochaetaceae bacterium]
MNEILYTIGKLGIVPVVTMPDADVAVDLAEALVSGGLPVIEIAFRTDAAETALRRITKHTSDVLVGAGTVRSAAQVDQAIDAGAKFVVTPGFNHTVVDYCVRRGITVIPGVNSPIGVEMAVERGLDVLKFFPAEVSGGVSMIKALGGPYPDVSFIPTGGVNGANVAEYLALPNVHACGGSWLTPKEHLVARDLSEIPRLIREALAALKSVRSA